MTPFTRIAAIAAPLPMANIDTDKILSARFLTTISRDGLGKALFHSMRYDAQDRPRADFILNRAPWDKAGILIALDNFGCGSSREHAPWALTDFGIRCVIAPGFADIFYNNCFKNGILPVRLPIHIVERLMALAAIPDSALMQVDLTAQSVTSADGAVYRFEIEPQRRRDLLDGADDIVRSLRHGDDIAAYERSARRDNPYLPAIKLTV